MYVLMSKNVFVRCDALFVLGRDLIEVGTGLVRFKGGLSCKVCVNIKLITDYIQVFHSTL